MNNDQKPRIRITIERVSVTTIRTRSAKIYCEHCYRALRVDDPPVTEVRSLTEGAATASVSENEKEKRNET